MSSPFVKKDEAIVLYNTHIQGARIFPSDYMDCTVLQQHFLTLMSANHVGFMRNLDHKVKILCEAMGVEFK